MVARLQGDWTGANRQAIAIRDAKPLSGAQDGAWLAKLLLASMPAPPVNRRTMLLMIDSERALGHTAVADKLVADMRQSAPEWEKRSAAKNTCRMRVTDPLWLREMQQTLLDIEMREFKCEPPEHTSFMAAE